MNLVLNEWTDESINNFYNYFIQFSKGSDDIEFEKKISNTFYDCVAIPYSIIDSMSKKIAKGNYSDFINKIELKNFSLTILFGKIISKIKNADEQINYLEKYISVCDSWAQVDTLNFSFNISNKQKYFDYAASCIKDKNPFKKRLGIIILLKGFINNIDINRVFDIILTLSNESDYYVNMAIAWLLCEAFVKCRDKTMSFLKNKKISTFVLNKTISKCRDSKRVSTEDKSYLKTLMKK